MLLVLNEEVIVSNCDFSMRGPKTERRLPFALHVPISKVRETLSSPSFKFPGVASLIYAIRPSADSIPEHFCRLRAFRNNFVSTEWVIIRGVTCKTVRCVFVVDSNCRGTFSFRLAPADTQETYYAIACPLCNGENYRGSCNEERSSIY